MMIGSGREETSTSKLSDRKIGASIDGRRRAFGVVTLIKKKSSLQFDYKYEPLLK